MTPGGGAPLPAITDPAVQAARARVEVHDNLGDEDRAAMDWSAEDDPNAIVGLSVAAVMAELTDLAWPERVEIGVLFGSNEEVADLNGRFRHRPTPTNVLSFPTEALAPGDPPPAYLGDLAFAHGVVRAEAASREVDPATHLATLAVHGVLHLIGHDHETSDADADAMERLEARVLARLGLPDPYEGTEPL